MIAATGCESSGAASTTTPGLEDADWIELSTSRVTLITDFRERRARKILLDLDKRAEMIGQAVFQGAEHRTVHTVAVVFMRLGEYQDHHPDVTGHWLQGRDADGNPRVTLVSGGGSPDNHLLEQWQQRLARLYLGKALGDLPPWLLQGMASYYAAAFEQEGKIRLGGPLQEIGFHMGANWIRNTDPSEIRVIAPSSQAIVPSKLLTSDNRDYYATLQPDRPNAALALFRERTLHRLSAWTFVHLMMSGVEPYAPILHESLATASQGGDAGAVMMDALTSIGWDQVDEAFYQHMARRETQLWVREFAMPKDPAITARALAAGEVAQIHNGI